ncbi:MAG TPA: hypothetical protein VJN64_08555 [Terriglobales bacterium]|nr:hypothetical protein [Terriglobales bacterium]
MSPSPNQMVAEKVRPIGVSLTSLFFLFGVVASGLSFLMLLFPGTPLDVLWHLNPRARESFLGMGSTAVLLMFAVCAACAVAAVGLWRCRRWGYWTAVSMLAINLIGDTINAFLLQDWRTLIGLPIAGLMIGYLLRQRSIFGS